ncbi:MAG: TSUP family transporter [Cypionkella sp.]|nr:TSUP family transporter [Cypionkella sp.]
MSLPFDLSWVAALYMGAVFLLAAFVRGYSGFGFSAMIITASALVTNPLNFVALVVVLETAMSLQSLRGIGRDIDWRRVGLLMGGAVVGLPIGLFVLTALSEDAVRAAIALLVLSMCLVLLRGWRFALGNAAGAEANMGFGLLSGRA